MEKGMSPFKINEQLGTMAEGETPPEGWMVLSVRDLRDGLENPLKICKKIDYACAFLSLGAKIMIKCYAGISRSNSIAMGILVEYFNMEWLEALSLVLTNVPRAQINHEFEYSVKTALCLFNPSRAEEMWWNLDLLKSNGKWLPK